MDLSFPGAQPQTVGLTFLTLITLLTMIDIWNITYGDEVSKDPKVGHHCLMNTKAAAKAQCTGI